MNSESNEYWAYNNPIMDSQGNIIGNEMILMTEEDAIKWWRYSHPEYNKFSDQECLDSFSTIYWAWKVKVETI